MICVNRKDLRDALRRAAKLSLRRSPNVALQCVKITTDADSVMLQATNLDQALVEILPGNKTGKERKASICVPALQLVGIVQALPQYLQEVPLAVYPDRIVVGTTKLGAACDASEYPVMPICPDPAGAIVELPDDFSAHQRFVRAAVSREANRYALTGVLFDFDQGNLVSSDGKRLHCAHLWDRTKLGRFLVPPAVFDLARTTHVVLPNSKVKSVNQVFFLTENGYFATRLIEGEFPEYISLVRKQHSLTASVDRLDFAGVIDQALPMLPDQGPACEVHMNETFEIRAENQDSEAVYANEIPAVVEGKELTIRLNPFLLRDLLKTMAGQIITIACRNATEAAYVVNEQGNQWALLMPLAQKSTPSADVKK